MQIARPTELKQDYTRLTICFFFNSKVLEGQIKGKNVCLACALHSMNMCNPYKNISSKTLACPPPPIKSVQPKK